MNTSLKAFWVEYRPTALGILAIMILSGIFWMSVLPQFRDNEVKTNEVADVRDAYVPVAEEFAFQPGGETNVGIVASVTFTNGVYLALAKVGEYGCPVAVSPTPLAVGDKVKVLSIMLFRAHSNNLAARVNAGNINVATKIQ